ncbi:MAG: HAD-IC family P-type ATPase [Gammaproteobacteria bacterium]|nr:HAD-IC family P-type ATPase [Gammaproteobacteria bacterium]
MLSQPPHTLSESHIIDELESSLHGLGLAEASKRLEQYGLNQLPKTKPPGLLQVFFRQFISPLIYVLLVAALFSLLIQEWSDAGFITAVLMINAIIGTVQEYSAQKSAVALQKLVSSQCKVLRAGETYELDAEMLVPGDIVMVESGDQIPADMRLLNSHDLEINESLLTGESLASMKDYQQIFSLDTFLGDRKNMLYAGTLVERGRGKAIVVSTALATELGQIAREVLDKPAPKAPLLIRMEQFTHKVAMIVLIAALIMALIAFYKGTALEEIFLLAVALAVSVIPEGLPVALTVALAIGMRRMAKRNVIIRRLVAVEALGSCTYIATDKTGTLTVNQLTVKQIVLPDDEVWQVGGEGLEPQGDIRFQGRALDEQQHLQLQRICYAAVLPNDAFIGQRADEWIQHGDAVDVALLVMAHKAGVVKADTNDQYRELAIIPFESERLFAASLNQVDDHQIAYVKGALERLLPMCSQMNIKGTHQVVDENRVLQQAHSLANQGYRVLALASGNVQLADGEVCSEEHLKGLELLGLLAMIDPLRSEARDAVASCRQAGIKVAMVTGDHPATALAIARELDLANSPEDIVTGPELRRAVNQADFDSLTSQAHVFARIEPTQKLEIVQSLQRNGHFVAVSGDGANDAPALGQAEVGVAMGQSGTDVARETASLIITDDNFSSIVAGVEEGRVAYANVRKVIFLLVSTGAAELVLFTLALLSGQPLPLLAVQLLWLNLVTNGIQDVALAFEPAEGNELKRPPRAPSESIFNRLMIERIVVSALVIGIVSFMLFKMLLAQGMDVEQARNATLLLMVLFENIHVFNSRSETLSVFRHNLLRNSFLLFGTVIAQLIHISAMYTPWISDVLHIQPVSLEQWFSLLMMTFSILLVMELHKLFRAYYKLK